MFPLMKVFFRFKLVSNHKLGTFLPNFDFQSNETFLIPGICPSITPPLSFKRMIFTLMFSTFIIKINISPVLFGFTSIFRLPKPKNKFFKRVLRDNEFFCLNNLDLNDIKELPAVIPRVDVFTTFSDDHGNSRLIQRCK